MTETKKTIFCDICGSEMPEYNGNLKLTHTRRNIYNEKYDDSINIGDICDDCFDRLREVILAEKDRIIRGLKGQK